ncbi:MAG: DUF1553 domain-containing protein [Fuerstiella sp.]|nr:DUF1553 domain-containing protein [Fuerstiella sp.]MCP4857515.1 DUF1553 domain-containing protein [Fuerstiella sp.]
MSMRTVLILLSFMAMNPGVPIRASEPLNFVLDIRPILSDKCFACHGPDKESREANLRFDTQEGATVDLGGHRAIVAGKPDESEFISRIESGDEDERMPPTGSNLKLTDEEKSKLRRWIAEGAKWEGHWAFQAIVRPAPPAVPSSKRWARNEIDAFVLAGLKKKAAEPSKEADRATWLRRVTQDLTGLPPTLAEIDAFTADSSASAYEKVVNRLLDSVDYAERMTAIWLDSARYADSNGFQFDNERTMWPWRDWVIAAFRKNMPYDQFVTEQLAGDLLETPSHDQLIATGFNRNHGYSIEGGIIDEEYRVMYANDKTTTFGTLFLGLTLECARCHDHKYDPLTMADYYSLYAFFNSSAERGAPGEDGRKQKAAAPFLEHQPAEDGVKPVLAMIMKDQPRETRILMQGLFDQLGDKVVPRAPEVLPSFKGHAANRLGLARWLTSPDNPLFARVAVNRLWQQFFGIGLVKTLDNLGLQGELPSHPRLLDWLASEFHESDWDLQHLIRKVVLSSTYRQSSRFRSGVEDPENRLLARGPTFRLPAELIRDQALAASGLLTRKVGGASVFPYQPDGVWDDLNASTSHAETYVQSTGDDLYRKSLYTYWRRAVPHPAMAAFDAPSRDVCTVQRVATNTPLQALVTLHGPTYLEAARVLAEAALSESEPIRYVFRRVLSRQPNNRELHLLAALHQERLEHYRMNPEADERLLRVGQRPPNAALDKIQVAGLADVCHTILNLGESLTRK